MFNVSENVMFDDTEVRAFKSSKELWELHTWHVLVSETAKMFSISNIICRFTIKFNVKKSDIYLCKI